MPERAGAGRRYLSKLRKDPAFRLAALLALIGLVLSLVVAGWMWGRAQQEAEEALAARGGLFVESAQSAVGAVVERLVAVGGLYQASEEVTQIEFRRFVNNFDEIPGAGGIGYMPIVAAEDLDEYVARMREVIPDYTVFGLDATGNRVPVGERPQYLPLEWFEPAEAFDDPFGFDSYSEANRRKALERAWTSGDYAITTFVRLVSEQDFDGFLVYWPVTDPETEEVMGFAVAPMDLGELLQGHIPSRLRSELIWRVEDVTEGRSVSESEGDPSEMSWSSLTELGGRLWEFTIIPVKGSSFEPDPLGPWLLFVAGVVASLLAAASAYQRRHRREVREELEKLKELSRAKDQFLASISHELRTPLTGVVGFAELLRDGNGDLTEVERQAMLGSIADQASDLAAIIDDLLVAARSELHLLAVDHAPVSARSEVAKVLEAAGPWKCGHLEVIVEGDRDPWVVGDSARVRQILRNLLSNACRYGGDHIKIRLFEDGKDGFIWVADDGEGVPEGEWERIFEPYYRAHSQDTQPAAVGIGLSVARQLARLMDGDLVYRREEGWSVFELRLPLQREEEVGDPAREPSLAGQGIGGTEGG